MVRSRKQYGWLRCSDTNAGSKWHTKMSRLRGYEEARYQFSHEAGNRDLRIFHFSGDELFSSYQLVHFVYIQHLKPYIVKNRVSQPKPRMCENYELGALFWQGVVFRNSFERPSISSQYLARSCHQSFNQQAHHFCLLAPLVNLCQKHLKHLLLQSLTFINLGDHLTQFAGPLLFKRLV
jgi:hypothetical protein